MNHRKTLGFADDAARSEALTRPDPTAEANIYASADELVDGAMDEPDSDEEKKLILLKMKEAAVARVRRHFGDKYAKVCHAFLFGRHWSKTGIPKRTFYYALKKVENFFHADKHWAKLHSDRRKKAH